MPRLLPANASGNCVNIHACRPQAPGCGAEMNDPRMASSSDDDQAVAIESSAPGRMIRLVAIRIAVAYANNPRVG